MFYRQKIVFRADASVQVGTGHVMRCLTLAEELRRQGHQCFFICRNHEGHLAEVINQKGFELHLLSSPELSGELPVQNEPEVAHSDWLGVSWQTDVTQTLEVLVGHIPDWLIVDHYGIDAQWERSMAEAVGQIFVIDDLADREHECAVLLDQNLGREPSDYEKLVPPTCKKLIGPKYALLRPEFSELRAASLERRRSPELKRILIFLGGIDRANATGEVLEALAKSDLPKYTELDIVMGSSAPHLDSIKKQVSQLPFQATVSVSVSDMAERMCAADFSFGAAGSTSWERCCLGVPSMMVLLANNQELIGESLAIAGCAELSSVSEINGRVRNVIQKISAQSSVLKRMSDKSQKICDGKGSSHVVAIINNGGSI